jgi:transcriptional regulator
MHPNPRFQLADRELLRRMVADIGFGLLFVTTQQGPRAVHVPVAIEGDRLRFHVSRRNAVHDALAQGATALFVATGPHAYLSPDDYGLEDRVPTWNYVAVEVEGPVAPIDAAGLEHLLDDLSARFEARLEPKPAWTRDRMSPGRFATLTSAIAGFEMRIEEWRATAKLDQDKPDEVRERLCDALDGRGETELAAAMRPGGWLE